MGELWKRRYLNERSRTNSGDDAYDSRQPRETPAKTLEEAADPLNGGVLAEIDGFCGVLWGGAIAENWLL